MITKAIIKEKKDNLFLVRIPLLESAGTTDEVVLTATLCHEPGNIEAYNINDVVFVGFENNAIGSPIILGKLYTGKPEKPIGRFFTACLDATVSAKLPGDTSVGDISSEAVYNALKNDPITQNRLEELEKQMRGLVSYVSGNSNYYYIENDEIDALLTHEPIPDREYKKIPASEVVGRQIATNEDIDELYM